jgi:hypothetical protein
VGRELGQRQGLTTDPASCEPDSASIAVLDSQPIVRRGTVSRTVGRAAATDSHLVILPSGERPIRSVITTPGVRICAARHFRYRKTMIATTGTARTGDKAVSEIPATLIAITVNDTTFIRYRSPPSSHVRNISASTIPTRADEATCREGECRRWHRNGRQRPVSRPASPRVTNE